ncbi:hypothetical protein DENSPDRAFT_931735 [Dentipellis sp. KUC8613]|nr:hypothetical protein DENSPDRAFT_931735 [Dentipellis sp. KUC8613]
MHSNVYLNPRPTLGLRNEFYYSPDGTVVFQVDDQLFNVPAQTLSERSPVFREMFAKRPRPMGICFRLTPDGPCQLHGRSVPPPMRGIQAGSACNYKPIHLKHTTAFEFETLMDSFFHKIDGGLLPTPERSLALLRAAHQFEVDISARLDALTGVLNATYLPTTPATIIGALEECTADPEHMRRALECIVRRQMPMSGAEAARMSREVRDGIVKARDRYFRESQRSSCVDEADKAEVCADAVAELVRTLRTSRETGYDPIRGRGAGLYSETFSREGVFDGAAVGAQLRVGWPAIARLSWE